MAVIPSGCCLTCTSAGWTRESSTPAPDSSCGVVQIAGYGDGSEGAGVCAAALWYLKTRQAGVAEDPERFRSRDSEAAQHDRLRPL